MRMKKFLIAVAVILLITAIAHPHGAFSDSDAIRHEENVVRLSKIGIFKGDSRGFGLERELTRAESAVLVIRLIGKEEEVLAGNYSHPFTDVKPWADKYVGYLYENRLTTGISPVLYGSDQFVT